MVTVNASQMARAAGLNSESAAEALVTLFSVAQAVGRLLAGLTADALTSQHRPTAALMIPATVSMALGHASMALDRPAALYTGVLAAGFGFGIAWPMMVLLVREFFGSAHVGSNYMIYDGLGSACGALVFAKLLVHPFYSAHSHPADGLHDDGDSETCVGSRCFPYVPIACLNSTAVLAATTLAYWPSVQPKHRAAAR